MGIPSENREDPSAEFSGQARNFDRFFEAQLSATGISDEQLLKQSLAELRDSWETLNDAIRNAESFEIVHLKMDAKYGLLITSISAQSHMRIIALSALLKKKKYVLERR